MTPSASASVHRDLIMKLVARHRLPVIYSYRNFVTAGGLISYGPDLVDQFRRAAGYVDRILKGEKPADMPVQAPTKFELVINLKTAKALGLTCHRRCSPAPTRSSNKGVVCCTCSRQLLAPRTSRSLLPMSVHRGEAVMPTLRSK